MNINKYKYYCDKCNYGTNLTRSYDKHITTILHNTGTRGIRLKKVIYKCEKCNYETTNNNNYLCHNLNNHSSKDERKNKFKFYCDNCDFGCFSKTGYDKHLKSKIHIRKIV